MNESDYLDGIKKTGFGLEYQISRQLQNAGWTVINNKYYIDDVQETAREIDILSYKVAIKDGIQIYTTLIVSCKKTEEKAWALLAKDRNNSDPNIDWNPVTLWSNHDILKLMIEQYDWKGKYVQDNNQLYSKLFNPEKHIFAFQELNKTSGKPQNDKAIFDSIVSSMKSQDYEIGSLKKRKKEKSIYNFNLVTVVEAPLYRVNYSDHDMHIEEINSDIYVGSYIINKKEIFSRVHFVKSDDFSFALSLYNGLHIHNIKQTDIIYKSYFHNCLKDAKKRNLFIEEFSKKLKHFIRRKTKHLASSNELRDIYIIWNQHKDSAGVFVYDVVEDEVVDYLNNNAEIRKKVGEVLKDIYHFEGKFHFEHDLPF